MTTKSISQVAHNVYPKGKIVAKVINAGKEYKAGDTTITALKASLI